jgi:hypothetical protein
MRTAERGRQRTRRLSWLARVYVRETTAALDVSLER